MNRSILSMTTGIAAILLLAMPTQAQPLWEPQPRQTLVILGNTFAERMALFGYFETFLHARYPHHQLRIRNMGWSADTVDLQPRPLNFGQLDQKLGPPDPNFNPRQTWFNGLGADALFVCFGMAESFRGRAGLDAFRDSLNSYLTHHLAREYNGHSPPQIVLISPIAHEDLGPPWPDPSQHNADLAQYVQVMRQVAHERRIPFVDLYTPHIQWMRDHPDQKLTINGIHLSQHGDWRVSQWLARGLGLLEDHADAKPSSSAADRARNFRSLVNLKNDRFFRHFRAVNGEYIYGRRIPVYLQTGPNPELPHLSDEEMRLLHATPGRYDQQIWTSQEKPAPADVWADEPPL